MYKKLHKSETRPHREPYSHKGSFFLCVPERDIMLTENECNYSDPYPKPIQIEVIDHELPRKLCFK